jgi:hypothetical protein
LILATAGCAGKQAPAGTLPDSPTAVVQRFLEAVRQNDVATMGRLWGDAGKGPANAWFKPPDELQKRLMVIRSILVYEKYALDPIGVLPGTAEGQRIVRVHLTRNKCEPVVPFTVAPYRGGWLVVDIDLAAAGNPVRVCT